MPLIASLPIKGRLFKEAAKKFVFSGRPPPPHGLVFKIKKKIFLKKF